jgi:MYXO-CTERM domain-containing protein
MHIGFNLAPSMPLKKDERNYIADTSLHMGCRNRRAFDYGNRASLAFRARWAHNSFQHTLTKYVLEIDMKHVKRALAISLFAWAGAAHAAQVLINGDFEAGDSGAGDRPTVTASNINTLLPGWQYLSGNFDTPIYTQSGFFAVPAQSGNRYLTFGGSGQNNGAIAQTLNNLVVGESYDLSFWLATQQGGGVVVTESLDVSVSGGVLSEIASLTAADGIWTQFAYAFVANATSHTLTLSDRADPGDVGGFNLALDNVSVIRNNGSPNSVPLAPTSLLALAGLALLGRTRRRV